MDLREVPMGEKEGRSVCDWHYEGVFSCYDLPPYESMWQRQTAFCHPEKKKSFRAYYDGEQLVGFTNLLEEENAVFFGIGVHPHLCNQGYGGTIVRRSIELSQKLYPGKLLYLDVRVWNQRAIRCYEKAGFVRDGDAFEQKTMCGYDSFFVWSIPTNISFFPFVWKKNRNQYINCILKSR